MPRAGSAVGDLYVMERDNVSAPGNVRSLFEPALAMPPVREREPMADISGTLSAEINAKAGAGLLEGFLGALGAVGIMGKLRTEFDAKGVKTLQFRIAKAERDSVDPLALGAALVGSKLAKNAPFIGEQYRYYLVSGVARSRSISIVAHRGSSGGASVEIDVEPVAKADVGLSIERSSDGELTFQGARPLAFGVELYELVWLKDLDQFKLKLTGDAIRVRSKRDAPPLATPTLLGGSDADIFVNLGAEPTT